MTGAFAISEEITILHEHDSSSCIVLSPDPLSYGLYEIRSIFSKVWPRKTNPRLDPRHTVQITKFI